MPTAPIPDMIHVFRGPAPLGSYRWDSEYLDAWVPSLGPTAVCLFRLLNRFLDEQGAPVVLTVDDLARMLGCGGKHRRMILALDRLARVRLAFWADPSTLGIAEGFARLSDQRAAALPQPLRELLGHRLPAWPSLEAEVKTYPETAAEPACCADDAGACNSHGFGAR